MVVFFHLLSFYRLVATHQTLSGWGWGSVPGEWYRGCSGHGCPSPGRWCGRLGGGGGAGRPVIGIHLLSPELRKDPFLTWGQGWRSCPPPSRPSPRRMAVGIGLRLAVTTSSGCRPREGGREQGRRWGEAGDVAADGGVLRLRPLPVVPRGGAKHSHPITILPHLRLPITHREGGTGHTDSSLRDLQRDSWGGDPPLRGKTF